MHAAGQQGLASRPEHCIIVELSGYDPLSRACAWAQTSTRPNRAPKRHHHVDGYFPYFGRREHAPLFSYETEPRLARSWVVETPSRSEHS